jgi:hypothetical protein
MRSNFGSEAMHRESKPTPFPSMNSCGISTFPPHPHHLRCLGNASSAPKRPTKHDFSNLNMIIHQTPSPRYQIIIILPPHQVNRAGLPRSLPSPTLIPPPQKEEKICSSALGGWIESELICTGEENQILAEVGITPGDGWLPVFGRVYASIESSKTVAEPDGLEVVNCGM